MPGAVEAVRGAAARGVRTVFVTNNASRRPADVAAHLAELGFPAAEADVVTSSQAAAAMLAEQLAPGAAVLVVGTDALAAEVTGVGLTVTTRGRRRRRRGAGPQPRHRLAEPGRCHRRRARGSGLGRLQPRPHLPTERGPLPGNGSMVTVVRTASGQEPQVAGKPAPALVNASVQRVGARRPLMIGDRLDTDIEGGRVAGMPTLLVLTGVSDAAELLAAPPERRPDYVAADLAGLTHDPADLAPGPRPGWTVDGRSGHWTLTGAGDPVDALRALCAAHWADGGGPAAVEAGDRGAAGALEALGLSDASATVHT